ncbi:pseudouridine synthase [Candidatus Uabimicrobium amorphum]|uniref:Pseudouridine synthase n=1 Tax=Uabimicrobium amorphum TaxID=2596890 RepID=A0A5S9INH5_UABAM|nr:pseudouridine synthase [Candidatus Uabimicrobium amorphum]BBM85109.1 pseudouridine synthase [Candidatus Uabimicrobium amorphum]
MERLQKILATAGLGSRRACEQLILQGRVTVDGKTITELGTKVNTDTQKIVCDGETVKVPEKVYYMFNKPRNVLSTNEDHQKTIMDFFKSLSFKVFPVGRLDKDSEGMILVTNDGAFAQKVLHPKYGIRKIYVAQVKGRVTAKTIAEISKGVWFKEGKMRVSRAKIIEARDKYSILEIELREGRNREVRRIMARVGHEVKRLIRVKIGKLELGDLDTGKYRTIDDKEIKKIFANA